MTSWLILGVMAWTLGVITFFVAPILVLPALPRELRTRFTRPITNLAQRSMGRSLIVPRSPGADWISTTRDGEFEAEQVTVDGETGHARDVGNLLGRLGKQPLGFVHPEKNMIYDLRACAIGTVEEERVTNNEHIEQVRGEGGQQAQFRDDIVIPESQDFVPLDGALPIIPKSAPLTLGERTETYVENALSGFQDSRAAQFVMLLAAFATGVAMYVIPTRYILSGGGDSTTTLPDVAVTVMGVVPV